MLHEVEKEIREVSWEVVKSERESGYTLRLASKGICRYALSKFTPNKQIQEKIKRKDVNKETIWIVYGYLFGYPIHAIETEYGEGIQIIVIEPNEKLLLEQLEIQGKRYEDFAPNIHFFTGYSKEKIKVLLKTNISLKDVFNIEWYINDIYIKHYANYFKYMGEQVKEYLWTIHIDKNTIREFSTLFLENIIKNRAAIGSSYDIRQHQNAYKNIPAVVVSAGPSLEKNIQYIKEFKGLIFTGGRSLGSILEQGTTPDFLVSLDPADITYDTLRQYGKNDLPLITADMSNHKVIEHNTGPKYFVKRVDGMTKELLGIDLEEVPMGGSVATLCIGAAYYMGCNPIILIGQDLAYTNNKTHASMCMGEEMKVKEDKVYQSIPGYYGDKVLSDAVLIYYLRWIEDFIKSYTEVECINATEGGAHIKGAIHLPFKDMVEQYNHIEKPKIEHQRKLPVSNIDKKISEYTNVILENLEVIKKGKEISLLLLEEYEKHQGVRAEKIKLLVDTLENEVDSYIRNSEEYYTLGIYLFNKEWTHVVINNKYKEKLNETEVEKGIRIANISYEIYKSLEQCINQILQVMRKEIKND